MIREVIEGLDDKKIKQIQKWVTKWQLAGEYNHIIKAKLIKKFKLDDYTAGEYADDGYNWGTSGPGQFD